MKQFLCAALAGAAILAGSASLSAQSKSSSTSDANVTTTVGTEYEGITFDSTESIRLDNVGHEMLVTPIIASVKVITERHEDGSYERATFTGKARKDVPKGLSGNEYLASVILEGRQIVGITIDQIKAQATYDFCAEYGADLIVLPQFNIHHKTQTLTGYDKKGNAVQVDEPIMINGKYVMVVDVVGYPAIYTDFRDGTVDDAWIKRLYLQGGQASGNRQLLNTESNTIIREE